MAREKFENRKLTGKINVACKYEDGSVRYWTTTKETVIAHVDQIVTDYQRQGYVLTLRQLHYQLVARNWIVNHQTAYKKLGTILDDCRYGGLVDWSAIEDRGRVPYLPFYVDDHEGALNVIIDQYRLDLQLLQPKLIELWSEKDALAGILRQTTSKYHVKLVVNKGYSSSSAMYDAYGRFASAIGNSQKVVLLYFGDHDPSGLDMIRDITKRLTLFLSQGNLLERFGIVRKANRWFENKGYTNDDILSTRFVTDELMDELAKANKDGDEKLSASIIQGIIVKMWLDEEDIFKVVPIGLTMAQIKKYDLPENPTKATDTRSNGYIKQFGQRCWEVDALDPDKLTAIVEKNITGNMDLQKYEAMLAKTERERKHLRLYVDETYDNFIEENPIPEEG